MPLFRNAILRSPLQVQFDITNKCNFRCLHCYNKSGENEACHDELTDSEVIALFADFAKMRPFNICFCGGEPLLRKELILTVSHKVKGFVPNLSIVTNGYLLDEKVLTQLIDSGINRIQLSIDGITKKTHEYLRGKKESLDRVFNALDSCIKSGKLKELLICFTPTSFNVCEFPQLVDCLVLKGVNKIRVQPLMLTGRAETHVEQIKPKQYQYDQLFNYFEIAKRKYGENSVEWGDPVDHIIRFRQYLSKLCTNLIIKSNGNIVASPYIPISFGNIRRHGIEKYWATGLEKIWQHPKLQSYASKINVVDDIGKHVDGFPLLWDENDLDLDIIEGVHDV